MRRSPIALVAAAIGALVVGLGVAYPFLREARLLPSTNPQPQPLFEPEVIALEPDDLVCMSNGVVDEHSEVAYVKVGTRRKAAVPLAFSVEGDGYRTRASRPPDYADNDVVSFLIDPPAAPKRVRICVRNRGKRVVDLYAVADRTRTRVDTFLNGELVRPNYSVWFGEQYVHSFAKRSPTIAKRLSAFRPGGAWIPWVVTILLLAGVPLALVAALWRAAAHDDEAAGA